MVSYGFERSHATLYGSIWAGGIWALAAAWIWFRRQAILGSRPHWALWLLLVALVAPDRPNVRPSVITVMRCVSLAIGSAAVMYAVARRPRYSAHAALVVGKYILWFTAVVMFVGAAVSQLGLDRTSYGIFNIEILGGGINDAIAAGIRGVFLIAGFVAHAVARNINPRDNLESRA